MRPKTLILRTAGTNCDGETAFAFERAGAEPVMLHVNRLLENPRLLDDCQILAIPGGFSHGDDIAAGRIFANQLRHRLADALRTFVAAGKPVIGICNGFQVLVKTDLLPGPLAGRQGQSCTLAHNDSGRFIDRWITLAAPGSRCVWTRDIGVCELPIAHGEGKFVPADSAVRQALWDQRQVALIYARPVARPADGIQPVGGAPGGSAAVGSAAVGEENPNGSVDAIAGICDATGLVFGLMPHPERHIDSIQHPAWTSRPHRDRGDGLKFFVNAVEHVGGRRSATVQPASVATASSLAASIPL
jgi:phosphoribosylformylglycinamidine synthase